MAQQVVIKLEDDLDGGDANETLTFGLDGVSYEIDLSDAHAAELVRRHAAEPSDQAANQTAVRIRAAHVVARNRKRLQDIRVDRRLAGTAPHHCEQLRQLTQVTIECCKSSPVRRVVDRVRSLCRRRHRCPPFCANTHAVPLVFRILMTTPFDDPFRVRSYRNFEPYVFDQRKRRGQVISERCRSLYVTCGKTQRRKELALRRCIDETTARSADRLGQRSSRPRTQHSAPADRPMFRPNSRSG